MRFTQSAILWAHESNPIRPHGNTYTGTHIATEICTDSTFQWSLLARYCSYFVLHALLDLYIPVISAISPLERRGLGNMSLAWYQWYLHPGCRLFHHTQLEPSTSMHVASSEPYSAGLSRTCVIKPTSRRARWLPIASGQICILVSIGKSFYAVLASLWSLLSWFTISFKPSSYAVTIPACRSNCSGKFPLHATAGCELMVGNSRTRTSASRKSRLAQQVVNLFNKCRYKSRRVVIMHEAIINAHSLARA